MGPQKSRLVWCDVAYSLVTTHARDTTCTAGEVNTPNSDALPQLSTMTMETVYRGAMEGISVAQYANTTLPTGEMTFTGLSSFSGTITLPDAPDAPVKKGTFLVTIIGTCGTAVNATSTIIPGSGTGQLEGISGKAVLRHEVSEAQGEIEVVWEIQFAK